MAKKFKVKTKENFGDKLLKGTAKIFKKSPQFIDLNTHEMEKRCIMIGNHSGASGAFTYRTFMEKRFMTWGAHQMCEGFGSRWRYLYHIFYRKKHGYSKFKSFVLATLFGMVSKWIYGFAGVLPVYFDMNVRKTFKYSFDCLEKDVSVFVFPENSENGYKEVIEEDFYPGFIKLSQLYFNKYGEDLPIYTLHFSDSHKKLVIGKPHYYQQLKAEMDDKAILTFFREYMNSLNDEVLRVVEADREKEEAKKAEKAKKGKKAKTIESEQPSESADV